MFWKHPITKKNRFLPVVHATNGIPSDFGHYVYLQLSKTSTAVLVCTHVVGSVILNYFSRAVS